MPLLASILMPNTIDSDSNKNEILTFCGGLISMI
jgi:hypothetical protein